MSFLERAKQAAEQARVAATEAAAQARQTAGEVAVQARHSAQETSDRAEATLRDPATRERARTTLHLARRTMSTAVERIDPGILADVVMKATFLQERANAALRRKGSNYRIGTVSVGASIPPSVSFAIVRVGDPKAGEELAGEPFAEVDEGEHLVPHVAAGEPITALDGTQLSEADLAPLADLAAGAPPDDLPTDDPTLGHHHSAV